MKLISEITESVEYIVEKKEDGGKTYFIKGPFLQSEVKNRNGRLYPKQIMDNEVKRYNEEYIEKNRAFGELGHPSGPTINLERVSHMIVGLEESGNDYIGKAKILETPYGQIVRNLIEAGATLGVSSRGMGSLKETSGGVQTVQDDYHLATAADIVADPSAPNAFVQGIMENKEWIFVNGVLTEQDVEIMKQSINESSRSSRDEAKFKAFSKFLLKL